MASVTLTECVEICGDGHKMIFFCSNCNRFLCGDCLGRTHKGALKGHNWEEIEDRLTSEGQRLEHLIKEIQNLSGSVDAAAVAKNAIDEESRETLGGFVAQVEQLLMSDRNTHDAKLLHRLQRDCVTLLHREASARQSVDLDSDPVDVLASRLAMNVCFEKQLEVSRNCLENADGERNPNVVEAIYKAAIALKGQAALEGLHYKFNSTPNQSDVLSYLLSFLF